MTTATAPTPAEIAAPRAEWEARAAVTRRMLRDARTRTFTFVGLFAAVAYIQPVSYRRAYPTPEERLAFAHAFAANKAVVLFYGKAYDLLTVGGYSAWRVGGILAILASVFGLLAAVRAMRADEDSGRTELVLAGIVDRRAAYVAALVAVAATAVALWAAILAGSVIAGLPAGGSMYLALAAASVIPVFVGVGAVCSQLAPTHRAALELGSAVLAVAFVVRVVADTVGGAGWLQWLTPLGWAERLRPFTGADPVVLLLPLAAGTALITLAGAIATRRDLGQGLLSAPGGESPRLGLLSSPTAQALRAELPSLIVWLAGTGAFAVIVGLISKSVVSAGISRQLNRAVAKLGSRTILSAKDYLGFSFLFFVLAISLFACAQVVAARHEEAQGRLETLLALPVSRRAWLGGRLVLAAAGAVAIALCAGLLAWVGAKTTGVHIPLPAMLAAGANTLPVALLFLGLAALAYATLPRASAAMAYGVVTVAFLWQLFGALLGAPRWLVDVTPFAHVRLVPAQTFRGGAAAVMLAIGVGAAVVAGLCFERRDLAGA